MATATTLPQFERAKEAMDKLYPMATKWLEARDLSAWCRAFFTPEPKCDMLLNNGCECFNSCILDGIEMGIVCMFDWIMEYVMFRLKNNREQCSER